MSNGKQYKLNDAALAKIGEKISKRHDGILNEPLPAAWREMLQKLDQATRPKSPASSS